MNRFSTALLLAFAIVACQEKQTQMQNPSEIPIDSTFLASYDNLPQNESGDIVREAIAGAGGWEAWTRNQSLSYNKTITFYDTLGNETRTLTQLHEYNLFPSFKARITWSENGNNYKIINNGQQAWKFENDIQMTDEQNVNSAYNSSYGSHYVMSMPFKLADPGCQLEYEGMDTIPDGTTAHRIKVTYAEGAGSSWNYHTWWYFFDPDTKQLLGNQFYGGGYSFTQYENFLDVDDLTFNEVRHSHQSDSLLNLKYISSSYRNTDVKLGPLFSDEYFEPAK
ncbi:MAG: DUF6503 family protein [Cyclobacteriaceae bacterium]